MNVKAAKQYKTLYFVMLALFTAFAAAATALIRIPYGIGYINFGDAVVMIASVILGPVGGAVVGGLGPAAADLATGYIVYAPFTAAVKAAEGILCGLICFRSQSDRASALRCLAAFAVSAVWVTVGYALTDFALVLGGAAGFSDYGFKAAVYAGALTMPATLLQTGVSAAVALIVAPRLPALKRDKLFEDNADCAAESDEDCAEKERTEK